MRIALLSAATLLALLGLGVAFTLTGVPRSATHASPTAWPPALPQAQQQAPALPPVPTPATVATLAQSSSVPSQPDVPWEEAGVMAELRRLGDSDPERSIHLAREGNLRFIDSPDAAERSWRIVKSLVNLQQFHMARDEARAMVDHYPRSRFTLEVQRHLLVNPLDYPSREEQEKAAQRVGSR